MSDRILIRDLRVKTHLGVTDEERAEPRLVWVGLEIEADLAPAGVSDDLTDTVDYAGIITSVAKLLVEGEFRLLEHAAEQIAGVVLATQRVQGVTVEISKEPPVAEEVGSVGVRISRRAR